MTQSQSKLRHRLATGFFAAVAMGTLTMLVVHETGAAETNQDLGIANCSTTLLSHPGLKTDSEMNGVIDPEAGVLTVHYRDSVTGDDRSFDVALGDRSCSAVKGLGQFISTAESDWQEAEAGTCASLREILEDKVAVVRGQAINHDAVKVYLEKRCS